jgi:hypothetical protein
MAAAARARALAIAPGPGPVPVPIRISLADVRAGAFSRLVARTVLRLAAWLSGRPLCERSAFGEGFAGIAPSMAFGST